MKLKFWIGRVQSGILIGLGILFVAFAILGAILPLLPTTPFLLLATACFARSSQRLNQMLHRNRFLGEYLRHYKEGGGMTRTTKIITLTFLWCSLGISVFTMPGHFWLLRLVPILVGVGLTIHFIRMKTCKTPAQEPVKPLIAS